jgi:hypothetical protein
MAVDPSLSETSHRRSRGSTRHTPPIFFVIGMTALVIMYSLQTENNMLVILSSSYELDLMKAPEDIKKLSPLSTAVAMSSATSWQVGQSELEREAPNLGEWQSTKARATAEPMLPAWILDMGAQHEKQIFSQYGEDGITEYILNNLPSPATVKTYVEFGVETGIECNTRFLRENHNWSGLMMDGGNERPEIGLYREMIHPDTIVFLFEKYGVQKKFGVFSEGKL